MADKQSQAPASSTFGQHDNAYVPHHISDHTKALQMSVRTENGWVNINDTLDQMNDRKDLHAVHDQVEKAQEDIVNAQSAADDAVSRADSAVKAAAVTSDAVAGLSDSVVEAKSAANDAISKAEQYRKNASSEAAEIRNQVINVANDISSVRSDVDDTASDVANLKTNVQANSAAIVETNNAVKIQSKNSSDAINELKIAGGQTEAIAKDANSNATLAKQTADSATTVAQDAQSNAIIAKQTATSAAIEATNASSTAAKAELTASGLTTRVEAVEGDTQKLTGRVASTETAIQQTKDALSLKADTAMIDQTNDSVNKLSAEQKIMANEISSKVTSTDVNNIVESKGYATTSSVQSLITQKAGSINESITNLTSEVNSNNGGGVNLAKNTINASYSGNSGSGNIGDISLDDMNELRGQTITLSVDVEWTGWQSASGANRIGWELQVVYADGSTVNNWLGVWAIPATASGKQRVSATWIIPDKEITSLGEGAVFVQANCASAKVSRLKIERGSVATPYSPAPSDEATVTQVQSLTASIDGLQSTVANKADKSQITQLSNVIQSKVSTSDFTSKVSQLSNDINARVTKGDLLSQINVEAGRTLIESNKIYLNADSVVFSKGSKAFIPSAAITEINADKITTGTLKGINIYGNDIVSFNKDESEQYSFVQIDEGGIYLGEAAKPDPSLIDYTERIGYTKVARIYSSKDADLTLVGNQINVKAPNYIHTSSDGTKYSTRTNLIINTVQPKNYSITTSAAGLFVTSQPLKSSKNSGYNDKLFGKVLTSRYETNESVWQSEANQIGAISGLAMDEDYLALQAPKKVTVNLSGDDSESSFDVQKNNFFTASFGADGSHDSIQLTANGRIGFHSLRANTIYFDHGDHGANHDSLNTCMVFGNFAVAQGQKNAIVKTSQGLTAIHAYETAEYYFGDIGENNTGSSSKVIVGIDQLFDQTVNTDVAYQVFLTPYSNAHLWVEKRYNNRFVVCSDQPNAQFGWELKARRKGYEHTRLTNFSQQIQ